MTGLTPSPSEVDTPSDNKADEEEDVGEPVGHHERCFIPRISLCDLMDLFRFFILFLCHGCVKSFVQFMLSTRSLGCSANILGPNQGIYIHLYSPQVSPFKRGRRLDFCWVGSTLMKILVKGLVHWIKWPETLSAPSMLQSIFPKSKPWLYIETSDLW